MLFCVMMMADYWNYFWYHAAYAGNDEDADRRVVFGLAHRSGSFLVGLFRRASSSTGRAGAREGMVGGRRSNAPARYTANYVKHAEQRARLPTPLLPGA